MVAVHGLTTGQVRNRFLGMLALRWLAVGLVIPGQVLLMLARGLTLTQVGLVMSFQGLLVLFLELPTGGLTDSWGRRPVLLLAGVVGLAAMTTFLFAHSVAAFAVAGALMGVFRALDSGPLEAWYVDCTQAAEPDHPIDRGLSHAGAVTGVAIAIGSVLGGALIAWWPAREPLAVPVVASLILQAVLLLITALLMTEPRAAHHGAGLLAGIRATPAAIATGFRLVTASRVLLCLVLVEVFWGFGMPAFESLTPVKLADLLDNPDQAAALLGIVGAAGWALYAVGAALAIPLGRALGVGRLALLMRLAQGATVIAMGLVAGVIGLVAGFLACYLVHGCANPPHSTLLHRQVTAQHRATVVSMNSMVSQGSGAVGTLVLTAVADAASPSVALIVAGVALALGAPFYVPAMRAEPARP